MTKFKVEIVKINGRIITLALQDEPERMNWSASEARHDYALYYDFNRISGLNF